MSIKTCLCFDVGQDVASPTTTLSFNEMSNLTTTISTDMNNQQQIGVTASLWSKGADPEPFGTIGGRNLFGYADMVEGSEMGRVQDFERGFDVYGWNYDYDADYLGSVDVFKGDSVVAANTPYNSELKRILKPNTLYTITYSFRLSGLYPWYENTPEIIPINKHCTLVLDSYADATAPEIILLDADINTVAEAASWQLGSIITRSHTFTTPPDIYEKDYEIKAYSLGRRNAIDDICGGEHAILFNIQLEEGNRKTTWKPAHEDLQQKNYFMAKDVAETKVGILRKEIRDELDELRQSSWDLLQLKRNYESSTGGFYSPMHRRFYNDANTLSLLLDNDRTARKELVNMAVYGTATLQVPGSAYQIKEDSSGIYVEGTSGTTLTKYTGSVVEQAQSKVTNTLELGSIIFYTAADGAVYIKAK